MYSMFDEILQKGVYKKSYFVILEHAFLRNPDYTTTEKMVYLDLMGYAGQANSAFPSKSSIAKDLGISIKTVERTLISLEQKNGLLIINREWEDKSKTSNLYILADIDKDTGAFVPESIEKYKCMKEKTWVVKKEF